MEETKKHNKQRKRINLHWILCVCVRFAYLQYEIFCLVKWKLYGLYGYRNFFCSFCLFVAIAFAQTKRKQISFSLSQRTNNNTKIRIKFVFTFVFFDIIPTIDFLFVLYNGKCALLCFILLFWWILCEIMQKRNNIKLRCGIPCYRIRSSIFVHIPQKKKIPCSSVMLTYFLATRCSNKGPKK